MIGLVLIRNGAEDDDLIEVAAVSMPEAAPYVSGQTFGDAYRLWGDAVAIIRATT